MHVPALAVFSQVPLVPALASQAFGAAVRTQVAPPAAVHVWPEEASSARCSSQAAAKFPIAALTCTLWQVSRAICLYARFARRWRAAWAAWAAGRTYRLAFSLAGGEHRRVARALLHIRSLRQRYPQRKMPEWSQSSRVASVWQGRRRAAQEQRLPQHKGGGMGKTGKLREQENFS